MMASKSEVLFVDPRASDIETIFSELRPGVEAVLLNATRPATEQIAEALSGRRNLAAVHIMAHGAPGRVSFTFANWSATTLVDQAEDFAAIGKALGPEGCLKLWSCHVRAGAVGDEFIDGLGRATGAHVAAAIDLVGSAARGGRWELESASGARVTGAPLTDDGAVKYAGVFAATLTSRGKGERLRIYGRWPAGTKAGTYFIVLNNGGTLEVLGEFIVPTDMPGTFAVSEPLPAGTYTVGPSTASPGTIAVYNGSWKKSGRDTGAWSVSDFNAPITATLNDPRPATSNNPSLAGEFR